VQRPGKGTCLVLISAKERGDEDENLLGD
jgi:hypothetical protein